MPWHIGSSTSCPASKPYAVIKDADGSVEGCHATKADAKKQLAAMYANEPGVGGRAVAVSDKPWSQFTQGDYSDEQWIRACLLDRGPDAGTPKQRYSIPVREPSGALNRNAVHAAAGAHGIGAVKGVSPEKKRAVARKLVSLYRNQLNEDPPDSLLRLAGMSGGRKLQEESMVTAERRFTAVPVETRAGDGRKIGGYAALHNTYSSNLGGFVEQFAASTWNETRGRGWPDVLARYNHDDNLLLGTTGGGTLRLEIDGTGLLYDVTLPQARADVWELVSRGDVRKSSVAFRVMPEGDEWGLTDQGFPLRTVTSAQLVDVAPVNLPAYPDTTAGVRRLVDPEVALRSLAAKAEAEISEVLAAAEVGELRRFLTTESDARPLPKPKPRLLGGAALAQVEALRDPWA